MKKEAWKNCSNHKGYEVSTLGNIRAVKRCVTQKSRNGNIYKRYFKARQINPCVTGKYKIIRARRNDGTYETALHRVVYETFYGAIPKGFYVNHINGFRFDNRPENLELCTPKENVHHASKLGLLKRKKCKSGHAFKDETTLFFKSKYHCGGFKRICAICHFKKNKTQERKTT